jgi:hypothetical protein
MIHGEADEGFRPLVTGRTRLGSRTAGRTISLGQVFPFGLLAETSTGFKLNAPTGRRLLSDASFGPTVPTAGSRSRMPKRALASTISTAASATPTTAWRDLRSPSATASRCSAA